MGNMLSIAVMLNITDNRSCMLFDMDDVEKKKKGAGMPVRLAQKEDGKISFSWLIVWYY